MLPVRMSRLAIAMASSSPVMRVVGSETVRTTPSGIQSASQGTSSARSRTSVRPLPGRPLVIVCFMKSVLELMSTRGPRQSRAPGTKTLRVLPEPVIPDTSTWGPVSTCRPSASSPA